MYNVKLKSVPNKAKTGSQLDYSLVDRNTLFLKPNTPVDSDVKNTISAVSRDKANIEAEGGETIIGDTNNDGFLEHQTIVGKRHTQGGVPLNVPEGSFIFSDTKKMTIKDPEVLAMFGMKPSKAGYTPAEIAKKYNVNEFIAILKDPAKDKYSKETAQIMLQSNLKKLGMLALIQESMKGFPDGVPAIAESIMGQMQGGQEQESPEQEAQEAPEEQGPQEEMQEGEQPMQRYGGTQLPKAQLGLGSNITGKTIYYHNQPYIIGSPDAKNLSSFKRDEDSSIFPINYIGEDGKIEKKYFSKRQLNRILNPTKEQKGYDAVYNARTQYSSNKAWDDVQAAPVKTQRNLMKGINLQTGDLLTLGADKYQVINPWGENGKDYAYSGKRWRDTFDNTQGIIHVKNLTTKQDEFLEGEDIKDQYRVDPKSINIQRGNLPIREAHESADEDNTSTSAPAALNNPGNTAPPPMNPNAGTANQQAAERAAAQRNAAQLAQENAQRVAQEQQTVQPVTEPRVKIRIKTPPSTQNQGVQNPVINGQTIESDPNLAYGGSTYKYQVGSTTTQPQSATPATTADPSPPKNPGAIKKLIWGNKTQKMYIVEYDENGKQIGTPYENNYTKLITREQGIDPKTKTKSWKYYAQFPDNMSSKDRALAVNDTDFGPGSLIVGQHGNQRINPKNPYKRFYGNTRPQDYEDRIVRNQLGDQATDAMDEITKRKKAFEILKINDVPEGDLTDAARLYNDEDFFTKKFNPAFESYLPEGTYRPQYKNDTRYGIEYLKSKPATPTPPGKKLAYQCVNGQVTSLEYEGDTLPAGSFTTSEEAGKDCGKTPQKPFDPKTFSNDDWWVQDRINLAGAITDPIHSYFPAMGNHNYMTPGYVLNDPTTQLRAVQQSVGSLQNQGFNSMSGNTAMAAASGLAGQGIDKAAEVLGNVGNSNVGIVNNSSVRNTDIVNKGIDMNENNKQVYTGNMARVLNNRDKEEQFKKWRMLGALNNGITNMQRRHQYEDMYKNVYIDPISGHRVIYGNATPQLNDDGTFAYDPYVNPYGGGSGVAVADPDILYKHYKENGSTHAEAIDKVNLQLKAQQIRTSGSRGRSGAQYPGGTYGNQSPYFGGGYGATADSAYGYDV